jgi:hypothetical protein
VKGFTKCVEIWNNTPHHRIHAVGLYLNTMLSYSCRFRFDAKVMDGFLQCVQRMVLTPIECSEISKQMEVYRLATTTFGYNMVVQNNSNKMLVKLQVQFVSTFKLSNFKVFPFYLYITLWKYNLLSFIFVYSL